MLGASARSTKSKRFSIFHLSFIIRSLQAGNARLTIVERVKVTTIVRSYSTCRSMTNEKWKMVFQRGLADYVGLVRVNPDLHPLQHTQVFIGQLQKRPLLAVNDPHLAAAIAHAH